MCVSQGRISPIHGHMSARVRMLKLQVCHCRMYDLLKERQLRLIAKRKGIMMETDCE